MNISLPSDKENERLDGHAKLNLALPHRNAGAYDGYRRSKIMAEKSGSGMACSGQNRADRHGSNPGV
jgi:hypothetical protein